MTANTKTLLTSTVAAEVAAGDVITCPHLARRCGSTRQSKPVHPSTVLRWILEGVKTLGGGRVRLEAVRCGGRWVTSVAAYQRFLAAQTPVLDNGPIQVASTPTQAEKRAERAGKELAKIGI